MIIRRSMTVFGATVAAVALTASAALAHECYNASRSDTGNANAVNGRALSSYEELLDVLCPAGDAIVGDWVSTNNFATDGILIQVNAVMGGGAHDQGKKATDGRDIDYLPADFLAAIGAAFGTCFAP